MQQVILSAYFLFDAMSPSISRGNSIVTSSYYETHAFLLKYFISVVFLSNNNYSNIIIALMLPILYTNVHSGPLTTIGNVKKG
jgi:hypothetical protein